ncbi:hypothetical protein [Paraburkholderia domus]|uniref:hypothetical protein n=1 Tax=Paraburkholderia domus TaxID=2793075 RepID=UPI001914662F|nr:hypothetical protein [Paraburkholderia domus]MBK5046937.1 hypothetical protein [Burkholderia sp. R-70006]MBK5058781.1 hypothetical protein [Burkholderia sp. R-70199]MBK5087792.1 hypothetical protein [Burkholderia sp. R-69927]MBK5123328.1 hypothetical protein [Burkholderia sp. R-69980]MBK5162933.1 hypothetical protein [Burkholderia sp. R-70211]MBK5181313.1 hypothetical protein [Burkholderia sp. R-69749]MCI0144998.1 hypothetical protein [Paraburkholderia sediminicola]
MEIREFDTASARDPASSPPDSDITQDEIPKVTIYSEGEQPLRVIVDKDTINDSSD